MISGVTADLDADLRTGEAALFSEDLLSPQLGDPGVDKDLAILFLVIGILIVESPGSEGDDPLADADLRGGEPHRLFPLQKGLGQRPDGLLRGLIEGARRLLGGGPEYPGIGLVDLLPVPEGQDFLGHHQVPSDECRQAALIVPVRNDVLIHV